MNKHEYLTALNKELKKLPEEERRNAIQYYMEYFDDAGAENEQKVILELGHPKEVANMLLSDYAIKQMNMPIALPERDLAPSVSKKGLAVLKWVIIALVASPIALPMAFALIVTILSVAGAVLMVVLAFLFASVVGCALGVVGCAAAIYLLVIHDVATFLVFAGAGLLGIAICLLLGMAGIGLGKLTIKLIRKFVTFVVERRKKKDEKKRKENELQN